MIATSRGVVIVRVCKAVLVAIVAAIMTLIALGNVLNYDANRQFVQHVLAMDTIFPGSRLGWRAITNPSLQTVAYLSIIVWEWLCAVVTLYAALALALGARSGPGFNRRVPFAVLGLTMVMTLFGGGFLAVGGEWFLMWQSTVWNGTEPAMRYFTVAGLTLLALLTRNGSDDATN